MNSNYSNGLPGQNIIIPQGTTRVKNMGVGKMFAAKNRGTKPYTTTTTTSCSFNCPTGSGIIYVEPDSSTSTNIPDIATSPYSLNSSFTISKMIDFTSTYTNGNCSGTTGYYVAADPTGNLFSFTNEIIQSIVYNNKTYTAQYSTGGVNLICNGYSNNITAFTLSS